MDTACPLNDRLHPDYLDNFIIYVTLVTNMLQGDLYEISYFAFGYIKFKDKDKDY